MTKREHLNFKLEQRQTRYFSESFKKKKVEELDKKLTTVLDICNVYGVSNTAVYKWIYKYSLMRKKSIKMVVEPLSDTVKIKALKEHINELEQMLGRKQFEIDFLQKQIDLATEELGVDFKKKVFGQRSNGFGKTENNTDIK
jgi:transposase